MLFWTMPVFMLALAQPPPICPTPQTQPALFELQPQKQLDHIVFIGKVTAIDNCTWQEVAQLVTILDARHRHYEILALQKSKDGLNAPKNNSDHIVAQLYLKAADTLSKAVEIKKKTTETKPNEQNSP